MNTESRINDLLERLKSSTFADSFSRENLVSALHDLLVWLNQTENNTDKNCEQIDYFISVEMLSDKRFEEIPEDVRAILFDMGATLHDTHSSPDIAENFQSTPAQLLKRLQNIYRQTDGL